jgi:hypothetical protein
MCELRMERTWLMKLIGKKAEQSKRLLFVQRSLI